MITGNTLIEWGFVPGKWFGAALAEAQFQERQGRSLEDIRMLLETQAPVPPAQIPLRTNSMPFGMFLHCDADEGTQEEEDQRNNILSVIEHMDVLTRTPTISYAAVMPDACPAGSAPGTIPVGGVVVADSIHPGFHSSDVCCSMAISIFKSDMPVSEVLDAAMKVTHFGPGGRDDYAACGTDELRSLLARFKNEPFLRDLEHYGERQFMTQGDGNHFLYVGHLASTGELAVVTHHGSRGLGAQLYKRGIAAAQRHTKIVAPQVPKHNAWLDPDSVDGLDYWVALQMVREWTKLNHFAIHDALARSIGNKVVDRFWNEHNFVFRRTDGLYYHGKGATPSFAGFSPDDCGRTLIPLNMGEPILICTHTDNHQAAGFAPHGAGRNLSRTAHMRRVAEEFGFDPRAMTDFQKRIVMAKEVMSLGIDARFYCGRMDLSEFPSAYKNPELVKSQIREFNLARVVDTIIPGGTIMAGDFSNRIR